MECKHQANITTLPNHLVTLSIPSCDKMTNTHSERGSTVCYCNNDNGNDSQSDTDLRTIVLIRIEMRTKHEKHEKHDKEQKKSHSCLTELDLTSNALQHAVLNFL